jgi:ATP-dependent DNA helicase DinG
LRDYEGTGKTYERFIIWTGKTKKGEKGELPFVPRFWSEVCGDSQDCNGKLCPVYDDCFYYRHYRKLHGTDILVVNHHLLVYDLLSDFNVLPFHTQLVIDEASDVDNVISAVLGSTFSHARTSWMLYRLRALKIVVDHLFPAADSFFKKAALVPSHPVSPIPPSVIESLRKFREELALKQTVATLKKHKKDVIDDELKDRIETTIGYVESFAADLDDFIDQGNRDRVYYMEGNGGRLELKSSLVESQTAFSLLRSVYESVIMTSATLTTAGNFTFIKGRLGIEDFDEKVVGSPFDYKEQSLLYVNRHLPSPGNRDDETFQRESLAVISDLISASWGRALVLFTSYRHLHYVAENIEMSYPFKSQGDMPPGKLVRWFRDTPHSVLLATATFWQGVDIRGDDLSLVIIGKLPFSSPGNPVYQERCNRLGNRWFFDFALPSAVLTLKQGCGRLIRSKNDYGVVAILDTRIVNSSYGKVILSSLPGMRMTDDIEEVREFFLTVNEPPPDA